MSHIPAVKRWKVTFYYANGTTAVEYVPAPTRHMALWAGREMRRGVWVLRDPDVVRETVSVVRSPKPTEIYRKKEDQRALIHHEPIGAIMPDGTRVDHWDERLRAAGARAIYR